MLQGQAGGNQSDGAGPDHGEDERSPGRSRRASEGRRQELARVGFFLQIFDGELDIVHMADAAVGVFAQAAQDDLLQFRGHVRGDVTHGFRLFVQYSR